MEAIHQVYEKIPSVITIPAEILDRHVRVTFEPLDEEPDLAALAVELGMKPEDILDPGILKFAGCMPDFPSRDPQGEYEQREEFNWE